MMRFAAIVVFCLFHLATFAVTAGAGEASSATPYSGDIWNRSTLTGDWGGLRNQLAEKGVTLDLSVTQIGQGVVGGDRRVGGIGLQLVHHPRDAFHIHRQVHLHAGPGLRE